MSHKYNFGAYNIEKMAELLRLADQDPLLAGFVYPEDTSKNRLPIHENEILIGFSTPRQDRDGVWRMGAIYILPEYRNKGHARKAIAEFMNGRNGRAFIEYENIASQQAYKAAGFKITRVDNKNGGAWWENF